MTIGERIKEQRELKGISQIELAKSVNIAKQTLYKYENDIITNIPSSKLEAIAKILKVSPTYLMGWEDGLKDDNIDLIPELLTDLTLLENLKKLKLLNTKHQETIYDMINFFYEKERG